MKILTLIPLAILAGCSSGGGADERQCRDIAHSYQYDQIDSNTGLTLTATTNDSVSFVSFERMVKEYEGVEMCAANNNTPGPTVTFTSFNEYGFQLELALYYYALQTVFIDTDIEEWLPVRNCISDIEFLRHEYMHHVLFLNGEDPGHSNPKFASCDALGPKTCNGEYCEK